MKCPNVGPSEGNGVSASWGVTGVKVGIWWGSRDGFCVYTCRGKTSKCLEFQGTCCVKIFKRKRERSSHKKGEKRQQSDPFMINREFHRYSYNGRHTLRKGWKRSSPSQVLKGQLRV